MVRQLEQAQRQNRASYTYWKLLLACETHEIEKKRNQEIQSTSGPAVAIMLTERR